MFKMGESLASRRRSLRRAVHLETEILSDSWDDEISLLATNLSCDGVWVQTSLPLDPGDEVVVSLRPPRWSRPRPLVTLARVARVGLHRRRGDMDGTGMGLSFVDIDRPDARALFEHLRGLPPPLPGAQSGAFPLSLRERSEPAVEPLPGLALRDGTLLTFRGDGALLTGGRALPVSHVGREGLAPVVPLRVARAG